MVLMLDGTSDGRASPKENVRPHLFDVMEQLAYNFL